MSTPFIRISYWPKTRIYDTPNKLQAMVPPGWDALTKGQKTKWAMARLKKEMPSARYVGWSPSSG